TFRATPPGGLMRRSTLQTLFRNLLAASAPLATVACDRGAVPFDTGDLATTSDMSLAPGDGALLLEAAMNATRPDPDLAECPPKIPDRQGCRYEVYVDRADLPLPDNNHDQCLKICDPANMMDWVDCYALDDACGPRVVCELCAIGRRPATL